MGVFKEQKNIYAFPRSQKCALCLRQHHHGKLEVDKTNTGKLLLQPGEGAMPLEWHRHSYAGVGGTHVSKQVWSTSLWHPYSVLCSAPSHHQAHLCGSHFPHPGSWMAAHRFPVPPPLPGKVQRDVEISTDPAQGDRAIFKLFTWAVCSQRVFLESKSVTEVPLILVQGPAVEDCAHVSTHTVQPWGVVCSAVA